MHSCEHCGFAHEDGDPCPPVDETSRPIVTEEEIRQMFVDLFPKPSDWWSRVWANFLSENPNAAVPFAQAVASLAAQRQRVIDADLIKLTADAIVRGAKP